MENVKTEMPVRRDMIWDLLFRLSGMALFALLAVAYFTGEEYPHTHVMIGYAIISLLAAGIFWAIVRPRQSAFPQTLYSPRGIKEQFGNADKLPKALATVFLLMAALPLCALILMLLTHTIWGATRIDEMHEVVAYFAVGLVAFYVVMVGIASIGHVENRVGKLFKGNKPRNEL
jgi:cytochrome b